MVRRCWLHSAGDQALLELLVIDSEHHNVSICTFWTLIPNRMNHSTTVVHLVLLKSVGSYKLLIRLIYFPDELQSISA